jgi:hypothetical protein
MKLIKYIVGPILLSAAYAHAFPVEVEHQERPEGLERPEKLERPEGLERPEKLERPEGPEVPKLKVDDDGLTLMNDQIKVTIEINPVDGTVHTSRTRTRNRGGRQ